MDNYREHQTLTKSPRGIIHNCFTDTDEKDTGCVDGKFMQTEKTTLENISQPQVTFCYSITCSHAFNL